jgi:hypothetical protein
MKTNSKRMSWAQLIIIKTSAVSEAVAIDQCLVVVMMMEGLHLIATPGETLVKRAVNPLLSVPIALTMKNIWLRLKLQARLKKVVSQQILQMPAR